MTTNKKYLKSKNISLVISDVDGVLTDGGMYYSKNGEFLKKFNTKDGMAVELLKKSSIQTIFVTKENSEITKQRAKKLKVKIYSNIKNKETLFPKILKTYNLNESQVAYIGDDVNDLEIIKKVGFSGSPSDSTKIILNEVDYVCKNLGGMGAFREFADLILQSKSNYS